MPAGTDESSCSIVGGGGHGRLVGWLGVARWEKLSWFRRDDGGEAVCSCAYVIFFFRDDIVSCCETRIGVWFLCCKVCVFHGV